MAKPKITKPTVDNGELSKNHSYVDLIDNEAFIFFPGRDEWRKRLLKTLDNWSMKADSYELQQFYDEYQIPAETMVGWREKYPELDKAIQRIKLTLGSRRRIGALTKKLDRDMVLRYAHKYDPEDRGVDKYHADLKKEETHVPTTFVIAGNGGLKKPEVMTQEEMEKSNDQSV